MNTENTLLQTREEEGVTYERTLVASEFIDWILQEGEMPSREEAEQLGRRLLEHSIIQHGEQSTWVEYIPAAYTLFFEKPTTLESCGLTPADPHDCVSSSIGLVKKKKKKKKISYMIHFCIIFFFSFWLFFWHATRR